MYAMVYCVQFQTERVQRVMDPWSCVTGTLYVMVIPCWVLAVEFVDAHRQDIRATHCHLSFDFTWHDSIGGHRVIGNYVKHAVHSALA